ncbi:tRNA threonylcarbamoyladenosine biosynthesis protein TsaE [Hasllibacter halocynthiae]|uniref:tRNA threonylcarbamoyladenosine biosynthesis protein TsaE n=1 Tax=Hasllibacter halocynthiae TaxID=595589 RepID=A0A2T0X2K7_9RHOB|nr:tRNA (adenosine(37)-N6)-threonylcarbamoyltransferase complex ATPase subunit type 1 TsaE [Hasllibacter halocynthiae]PRY93168.1 tRNA threonylcarbamoyladenosine biosynthesis protein TsaE [Hasllibacter halocynthiae]
MTTTRLSLPGPDATDAAGAALARHLAPGATVLLSGELGAGKTHLARAAIRALAGPEVEVVSPTFTLVQTYATPLGELWHADLYRIEDPSEVAETGLEDALGTAICLIEWPERMGVLPRDALRLSLRHDGDGRVLELAGGPRWDGLRAALAGAVHA